MQITKLPNELLATLFSYVPAKPNFKFISASCKLFNHLIKTNTICWEHQPQIEYYIEKEFQWVFSLAQNIRITYDSYPHEVANPIEKMSLLSQAKTFSIRYNFFDEDSNLITFFLNALAKFSNLKHLDVSNNNFPGAQFAKSLQEITSLETLNLHDCISSNEDAKIVFSVFPLLKNLKNLKLGPNYKLKTLDGLIGNIPDQLTSLDISSIKCSENSLIALLDSFKNPQLLTCLKMDNVVSNLNPVIASSLKRFTSLEELSILNTSCSDLSDLIPFMPHLHSIALSYDFNKSLIEKLNSNKLTSLMIEVKTSNEANLLSNLISHQWSSLRSLYLDYSKLNGIDIEPLVNSLKMATNLTTLSLSDCETSEESTILIASVLNKLIDLKTLSFNDNIVGAKGLSAILEASVNLTEIMVFDLFRVKMDEDNFDYAQIATAIMNMNKLEHLNVRSLGFEMWQFNKIVEAAPTTAKIESNIGMCNGKRRV